MNLESRLHLHFGINFVFSPAPVLSKESRFRFQSALAEQGIEFNQVQFDDNQIIVERGAPEPLQIKIAILNPQMIAQLVVLAPHPNRSIEHFTEEAEAAISALSKSWEGANHQLIASDATWRDLYETTAEHAFLELWERRLGQSSDGLGMLGAPVLGGGLRLVVPPHPPTERMYGTEIKIEAYLQDVKKIFIEVQFSWQGPFQPAESFDPRGRLDQIEAYFQNNVIPFVQGGH